MIPWNRTVVAAVALIGVFVAAYLLLYKLGLVGSLICGVGGGCATVQAPRYALFLGIPVALATTAFLFALLEIARLRRGPAEG